MQLISKQSEEIRQLWGDLKQEIETESTLIIVEGRHDIQTLNKFGINGNITQLRGRPMTEVCDYAAKFSKVIVLTDFDRAGMQLAQDLQRNLSSRGLNVDLTYYHALKFYFKKVSKDIEGLFKIYQQIERIRPKK